MFLWQHRGGALILAGGTSSRRTISTGNRIKYTDTKTPKAAKERSYNPICEGEWQRKSSKKTENLLHKPRGRRTFQNLQNPRSVTLSSTALLHVKVPGDGQENWGQKRRWELPSEGPAFFVKASWLRSVGDRLPRSVWLMPHTEKSHIA